MADPAPLSRTKNPILRMIKLIGGWTLLVVGFIGLFLPILQGVLMMIAGLALLSGESRLMAKLIDKARPRFRLWRWRYHACLSRRRKRRTT